jgi:formylglycine-generating enzyme required for sulfatase activity
MKRRLLLVILTFVLVGSIQAQNKSTQISKIEKNGNAYNPAGIELIYVEGAGGTPSFYIGKYEVTQTQWQKVMGNNPSRFKGVNNPVEKVPYSNVQEFIKKLNAMTGRNYRLPKAAEWTYAANGGLKNEAYEYAGSNSIGDVAWYADNSGSGTHPVGMKSPNSIGIYDMTGNVWEWCEDCHDCGTSTGKIFGLRDDCLCHVVHGGSWDRSAADCRVYVISYDWSGCQADVGFRLVLVP